MKVIKFNNLVNNQEASTRNIGASFHNTSTQTSDKQAEKSERYREQSSQTISVRIPTVEKNYETGEQESFELRAAQDKQVQVNLQPVGVKAEVRGRQKPTVET